MTSYNLICPVCKGKGMLIRQEDLDEDGEFTSPNVLVGCVTCGSMKAIREWLMVETSEDGVLHLMKAHAPHEQ